MFLRAEPFRWLLPLPALVAAILILVSPGRAQVTDPVVSVDTEPTGNTATFVDTIDPCREVTVGPPGFDIDVTIEQVTDLAGFEAKLHYNPAVLKVTDVNYSYFLSEAGGVTDWGEATPDSDGTFSMVATLFPLPPTGASGSGVLARLTLEAVANGGSLLDLTDVKLADINGQPIQPADSNGVYLGSVNDAAVSVGGSCSSDLDGDGAPDDDDNCPSTPNPDQTDTDGDGSGDACDLDDDNDYMLDDYENAHACLDPLLADSTDNPDGDLLVSYAEMIVASDPCTANPELGLDTDGDGFKDGVEAYIGTDSSDSCPDILGTHDAWPPDIDINRTVDILDVLLFKPVLGTSVGDPGYDRRFDFNADATVNILDVISMKPHMGTSCTNP